MQALLPKGLTLVVTCLTVSAIGVSFIIHRVEQSGSSEIGHSPMGLFRSFLDHWLRKNPTALEERLLSLSTKGSIETKILSFSGENSRPQSSLFVCYFHRRPYLSMSDGRLPSSMLQSPEASQH